MAFPTTPNNMFNPNPNPNKEENFEAISPRHSAPMLISTTQKRTWLGALGWLFLFLFLVSGAASGYMYTQFQKAATRVTELESSAASQNSTDATDTTGMSDLDKLARHMILPLGEAKVTTITDADNLKKAQPLYTSARNGDQLITYPGVEIVYDPQADKIVHVRNLTASSAMTPGGQSTSTPVSGVVTVDVRNGAGTPGLAAQTANAVKTLSGYQVKNVGNASRTTYNTTLIINLTGKNVSALEKQFKTTAITSLPLGEAESTSDVVVIVGKNQ